MRLLLAALLVATSTPAVAKVKVPYLKSLPESDVCGSVPSSCQPSNAQKWIKVNGLDYNGSPSTILGRKFGKSIFQTSPCVARTPTGTADIDRFGKANIHAQAEGKKAHEFGAHVKADVDQVLRKLISTLPADLQADAEAKLGETFSNAATSNVDVNYHRLQLSQDYIDNDLQACLNKLGKKESVVVGASILEVSGDWTSTRVKDFVANFEATAAFKALAADVKAKWTNERTVAVNGTFDPTAFVFAVATRKN